MKNSNFDLVFPQGNIDWRSEKIAIFIRLSSDGKA